MYSKLLFALNLQYCKTYKYCYQILYAKTFKKPMLCFKPACCPKQPCIICKSPTLIFVSPFLILDNLGVVYVNLMMKVVEKVLKNTSEHSVVNFVK